MHEIGIVRQLVRTVTAFAETIAANRPCYIHTIERPIERLLKNPNGALAQKEVGLHVKTGVAGIELAMRDGADVICFDHLESMEELNMLLQASNAGALVFAVTGGNNIHALLSKLLVSVPESNLGLGFAVLTIASAFIFVMSFRPILNAINATSKAVINILLQPTL